MLKNNPECYQYILSEVPPIPRLLNQVSFTRMMNDLSKIIGTNQEHEIDHDLLTGRITEIYTINDGNRIPLEDNEIIEFMEFLGINTTSILIPFERSINIKRPFLTETIYNALCDAELEDEIADDIVAKIMSRIK